MKKVLIVVLVIALIAAGAIWYVLSGAGDFIRTQIEEKGTAYLDTPVSVAAVEIAYQKAKMDITGFKIANPDGFTDSDAITMRTMTFDLGAVTSEPYVVQNVAIDAPEILYEMNAQNESNLLVLKQRLQDNLPAESEPKPDSGEPMARVIVEQVTISNAKLRLDFEAVNTADLQITKKNYEVTLPTFTAGPVGKPDGLPANEVGAAILDSMLEQAIAQGKEQAREKVKEKAREKLQEKTDELKDKAKEKAKEKLKGLFEKDN